MEDTNSLSHAKWECKYHVLRELAQHKESEILEGRMLLDHVHMLIAIPRSMRSPRSWGT